MNFVINVLEESKKMNAWKSKVMVFEKREDD